MRRLMTMIAAVALAAATARAGVLSVPDDYTPGKSWPVIVSLQDNPDPALTKKSPYFSVHAGGKGVECSLKIHSELKSLIARYNIDPLRIYGTGFSRGGHELLEQTWQYPHIFAAIIPVCNDLRTEPKVFNVKYIRNTPTLLMHGNGDSFRVTGQRLHSLMTEAGIEVPWQTYPGGHSPAKPFKEDLSLLTKFYEKHAMNTHPKEVTHVVFHPRYARAFWVDSALVERFGETATKPAAAPAGTAPAASAPASKSAAAAVEGTFQKAYFDKSGVFTVRVKEGNRIEVEANEWIQSLDLYLTDKLVDMSKPVKVVMGAKTLFEGPAAAPVKVVLSQEAEWKMPRVRPLWEELVEIQKKTEYKPLAATQPATQSQPAAAK